MSAKKSEKKLPNGLLSKPVLKDVVMVIDIDGSTISDSLYKHLNDSHTTYKDQVIKENIINISDALEEAPKKYKKAIEALHKIAADQLSSYVRFTNC